MACSGPDLSWGVTMLGPITKRPSGPRQMGSRGKGPRLGGSSRGELEDPGGSLQSRLWCRLGTGEAWGFSLATLSGLLEPGTELGKNRVGSLVGASPPPRKRCQAWRGLVHNRAELGELARKDIQWRGGGRQRQHWTAPRLGPCMSVLTSLSHFCSTSHASHPKVHKRGTLWEGKRKPRTWRHLQ